MSIAIETQGDLPGSAQQAWLAYQQMAEGKQAYFSLLNDLDWKDKQRAAPTMAEQLHLENLLKQHDDNVKRFSDAMATVTAPEEREALLQRLSLASAGQ